MPDLTVVLLAAGASRRLGRSKQLVDVAGEPLVRRSARRALETGAACHVVLGDRHESVSAALDGLPITPVFNPDWAAGMGRSIACGVASLPKTTEAALLLPCDLPLLTTADLQRLIGAWRRQPRARIAAGYAGGRGIPVIFPRPAFPELAALDGDRGAAAVLNAGEVVVVDCPNAAFDLDTPEALAALTRS